MPDDKSALLFVQTNQAATICSTAAYTFGKSLQLGRAEVHPQRGPGPPFWSSRHVVVEIWTILPRDVLEGIQWRQNCCVDAKLPKRDAYRRFLVVTGTSL